VFRAKHRKHSCKRQGAADKVDIQNQLQLACCRWPTWTDQFRPAMPLHSFYANQTWGTWKEVHVGKHCLVLWLMMRNKGNLTVICHDGPLIKDNRAELIGQASGHSRCTTLKPKSKEQLCWFFLTWWSVASDSCTLTPSIDCHLRQSSMISLLPHDFSAGLVDMGAAQHKGDNICFSRIFFTDELIQCVACYHFFLQNGLRDSLI